MVEIINPPPLCPHTPHSPPPLPHPTAPSFPLFSPVLRFDQKSQSVQHFFSPPVRHRPSGRRVEDRQGYIYSLTSPLKRTYAHRDTCARCCNTSGDDAEMTAPQHRLFSLQPYSAGRAPQQWSTSEDARSQTTACYSEDVIRSDRWGRFQ